MKEKNNISINRLLCSTDTSDWRRDRHIWFHSI